MVLGLRYFQHLNDRTKQDSNGIIATLGFG